MVLSVSACATTSPPVAPVLSTAEYRQQAYHSIYEKRYADGARLLELALELEPQAEDYLLLSDLYAVQEQFSQADNALTNGLQLELQPAEKQRLIFQSAVLKILAFEDPTAAERLVIDLPADSPEALTIEALLRQYQRQYDQAIRLTEKVAETATDSEMKGWAYFLSARSWVFGKDYPKAFEALFHAINHARGHSLEKRITQLWEELRAIPQAEQS
jgi:tetratricopeptide (TPR) repeat protein